MSLGLKFKVQGPCTSRGGGDNACVATVLLKIPALVSTVAVRENPRSILPSLLQNQFVQLIDDSCASVATYRCVCTTKHWPPTVWGSACGTRVYGS